MVIFSDICLEQLRMRVKRKSVLKFQALGSVVQGPRGFGKGRTHSGV